MRVMAPAVLCFLFLLATVAPPDVTTLTPLSTLSQRTVRDPGRHVQDGNCGQGFCICWDDRAKCIGDLSPIKRFPALPSNTVHLFVFYFDLQTLSTETARDLMTLPLQDLQLFYCKIESIDPAVLATFRNLSTLSLNLSPIPEAALHTAFEGLSHRVLEDLELFDMGLKSLFPLESMQSTTVVALDLSFSNILTLNMSALQGLKGLSKLDVGCSNMKNVYLAFLPDLTVLNLRVNEICDFPDVCLNGTAVLPKLEHLVLSDNEISAIDSSQIQCLTSLRTLDISYNKLFRLLPNTFSALRSLETIRMGNMKTQNFTINPYSFNNSNLFCLDMSDIHLSVKISGYRNIFAGCHNLSFLNFSGNDLSSFSDDLLSSLFSDLPELQQLSAGRCQLNQIPEFLFSLLKLNDIDLSGNLFSTLTEALPMQMQNRWRTVDLSNNPFQCSCSWLWLKEWIARNTTEFLEYPDHYKCANPPYTGLLLADLLISEQSCLLGPTTGYLVVALSSVLLFLMSILPVIYRYRWNIQYLAFMLRYDRHRHNRNALQEARHFRYDAFVIYDSKDHAWVVNHLMAALEDTQELRLCLHERDFLAGNLIVDNIVDNIKASRKVIAIMSEGSATSEWCQFELSLSHRLTLERGHDLLVVVMLEEVARAHVTRTMYAVLKTTTYIAWPDEERAREAFWNRLGEAVRL